MYLRNLSLICFLGFIAQACATLADENDPNGTADWLVMAGTPDKECNVILNAASITALGESQCSFDATVDLSEDVRDYQEVQLLLHIGAGDWTALSSDAEISGAPDGFQRFLFHIENFTCDSVEFIPFYSTVEGGEAGYVWDHNRIGDSGTTVDYYKLSMGGDRIHKVSMNRIDASNVCQLRNGERESIVELGTEPQAESVRPTATMIGPAAEIDSSEIGESEAGITTATIRHSYCERQDANGRQSLTGDVSFSESGSVRTWTRISYHVDCTDNWCRQTDNKNNVNFTLSEHDKQYKYSSPDNRVYGVQYLADLDGWETFVGEANGGYIDLGWWEGIFDISGLPDESCGTGFTQN